MERRESLAVLSAAATALRGQHHGFDGHLARTRPETAPNPQGMAEAGALFSYGSTRAGNLRRSAHLVDKVLRGAKPADLPVEQATEFELVVNMNTANALGVKIPQSILMRADRVIE